ncbi:MAG: LysR family transcriptional regulator [Alphaproteobacteria bacterium]|nr:LysR family transcriptional regulator [Alphaproteobacteria bacterium]
MELDVADLRLLVAIVQTGSLTRAAASLEQSLNVVSRRLQRLEATSGVQLVRRTTRRLTVTEAGERLHRHAIRALVHVDAAVADLAAERAEPVGTVRVVLPSSTVTPWLLNHLRELRATHPRLHVRLLVTDHDQPLGGDVDLAVVVGPIPDRAGVVSRRVATVRWAFCAAPSYIEAHGMPTTPEELGSHDCLRFRGTTTQDTWTLEDDAGRRVTVPVGGGFESDDSRALGEATYAGLGIGIRPARELADGVASGRLVHVLPGWWFSATPVSLVGPPARERMPAVRVVADALIAGLRSL